MFAAYNISDDVTSCCSSCQKWASCATSASSCLTASLSTNSRCVQAAPTSTENTGVFALVLSHFSHLLSGLRWALPWPITASSLKPYLSVPHAGHHHLSFQLNSLGPNTQVVPPFHSDHPPVDPTVHEHLQPLLPALPTAGLMAHHWSQGLAFHTVLHCLENPNRGESQLCPLHAGPTQLHGTAKNTRPTTLIGFTLNVRPHATRPSRALCVAWQSVLQRSVVSSLLRFPTPPLLFETTNTYSLLHTQLSLLRVSLRK